MRNWLKQAGRIHDFTGYDSDDDGEHVPGDTRTAQAERRKARREAHEDWVAPKVFIAPDGSQVVVRKHAHAALCSRADVQAHLCRMTGVTASCRKTMSSETQSLTGRLRAWLS